MRIVLVGNPNVGKSTIFLQLTGVNVTISNYPGTTVDFTRGSLTHGDRRVEVIDAPGTYGLEGHSEAERVAVELLEKGDIILNVVDATNLERNLNLTLQLLALGKPMVVALNMWDETKHKGIEIEAKKLSALLGVPVVTTSGRTGEGLAGLPEALFKARAASWPPMDSEQRWVKIGEIIKQVQNLAHRRHTWLERLQDLSVHPFLGFPLAILVLGGVFRLIIGAGEAVSDLIALGLQHVYTPFILRLHGALAGLPWLHAVLLGRVTAAGFDYETAMGVLTTGVFVAFGLVLPFVFLFYSTLGFLEDLGYLPRVAVLFDRLLHRIGVHGYSVIPMLLGCGCNVPGVLAVRNLESRRERFITAVIIATTIPCTAQTAMVVRTVGERAPGYILLTVFSLGAVWIVLGRILALTVRGSTPTLLLEMPPYRLPEPRLWAKKTIMRTRCFLAEAVPYFLGGVAFVNLLQIAGAIRFLGHLATPVIKGILGLPAQAVAAMIVGIIRKDAAMAMLAPLGLNDAQIVVATLVLVLYFPCVATFAVLWRELGPRDLAKAIGIMAITALSTGGALRFLLALVPNPLLLAVLILGGAVLLAIRRPSRDEESEAQEAPARSLVKEK
ncbi:MAG: ferrous iron transporter B [Firmicutes bacterium]|nr:ferrous iron transporter B [Bacillota bacterium]